MAKKDVEVMDTEEEKEGGSKIVTILVTLVIILIWLAILALCIKWDVGGFGSEVLQPVLKDVPVLNKILPEVEDEELGQNENYPYATLSEAISRIQELENQLKTAKDATGTDSEKIAELEAEVARLKQYEERQAEFLKEKEQFYEDVVYTDNAPNVEEYKKYYESIEPENAENLYKQVVQEIQYDEKVKEYAKAYSAMKPAQAAGIMEAMTDNLELAAKILEAMGTDARGQILGAMNADVAAQITKIMEPDH
ncbi:MAG: hypothetical protein HFI75_10265 [Lachnospiraceae bacterium]|nr:hypothetical protein [Lachnospiraceae bacterium]